MGYKKVCLSCKIAFNRPFESNSDVKYPCPTCGKPMIPVTHRFRAPKKSEINKWETVAYLFENGFYFQPVYETQVNPETGKSGPGNRVPYPENLREAKEFAERYKNQAEK